MLRPRFTLAAAALLVAAAHAQTAPPPFALAPCTQDTGLVAAPAGDPAAPLVLVDTLDVHQPGADWVRLHLADVQLAGDPLAGTGGELRVVSVADGAQQRMNAFEVERWARSTAYFNGDALVLELWAHPGTGASRVALESIEAGLPGVARTLCGPDDDRTPSADPRVGRLLPAGCTAWLIDDCGGCFLTAGHCVGTINVVEFGVPDSTSTGAIQHPGPEDQYPVDLASIQSNGGQGLGNDYAYFGTFPNGTTGLRAVDAQGPGFTLASPPAAGAGTIRVTGYGTDDTPPERNYVQQSHVGPLVDNDGAALRYATDTTGGNSGSPLVWVETGLAVGIHTHGGCGFSGGSNVGTSYDVAALQDVLAAPRGVCARGIGLASEPRVLPRGATQLISATADGAVPGSVSLHWRSGPSGLFAQVPMNFVGGGLYTADLPGFECGDTPEYFVSAQFTGCGQVFDPVGGPAAPIAAVVGDASVAFADDFEAAQPGWSTLTLGATGGAWQRGAPVVDPNWPYGPLADGDGSGSCYLTENGPGNTDVDSGEVVLVSPTVKLDGIPSLRYWRSLLAVSPDPGDGLRVDVSGDGGTTWHTVRDERAGDGTWARVFVSAAELAAFGIVDGGTLTVRFTATDLGGGSIVEAAIDGFGVEVVTCSTSLGDLECSPATVNSTGVPATLRASGSTVLGANDLVLDAAALPPQVFGFVLVGSDAGMVPQPGGSVGVLCVGGSIGRQLDSLANTGPAGMFGYAVDWTALAQPSGHVAAQVGDVWRFQLWYRDVGPSGATSNTTNTVAVTVE